MSSKKQGKLIKSKKVRVLTALSVFAMVGALIIGKALPLRADELHDEINYSKDKINENKARLKELEKESSKVKAKIDELAKLKSDIAEYIKEVDASISEADSEIAAINESIDETNKLIAETKVKIAESKENKEEQYASMKLRIKYMYEHSKEAPIEKILKSGSLSSVLNKIEYIGRVTEYDRTKLDEYSLILEEIELKEEELNSDMDLLTKEEEEASKKKDELTALLDSKKAKLAEFNDEISSAESEKASAEKSIAEYKKAIEAEENNIAAIEAKIRKQEEEARKKAIDAGEEYEPMTINDISFIWPIPGETTITSSFGDREAPIEGASTSHKGIDISAPTGTKVVAAAAGTVVIATYSASAGNYIMISHGSNVYTVYMHLSSLKVSEGDLVSSGDTIALSGSTGYSTGPHLHFGVRIDGKYVNPKNYV